MTPGSNPGAPTFMKVFISYRFTGESKEDLDNLLTPIKAVLDDKGIDLYCNYFDNDLVVRSKNFAPQDYVFDAFSTLNTCQILLALIKSSDKSEGMILEVGYAIAKGIPVIVAVKDGVSGSYLPGMANRKIEWSNTDDLSEKIANFDFSTLYS